MGTLKYIFQAFCSQNSCAYFEHTYIDEAKASSRATTFLKTFVICAEPAVRDPWALVISGSGVLLLNMFSLPDDVGENVSRLCM